MVNRWVVFTWVLCKGLQPKDTVMAWLCVVVHLPFRKEYPPIWIPVVQLYFTSVQIAEGYAIVQLRTLDIETLMTTSLGTTCVAIVDVAFIVEDIWHNIYVTYIRRRLIIVHTVIRYTTVQDPFIIISKNVPFKTLNNVAVGIFSIVCDIHMLLCKTTMQYQLTCKIIPRLCVGY